MRIGMKIRALRKEQGLSLEQLSAKCGVALATLSRIENDKGSTTFRTHKKIADALDVPVVELFKGIEPKQEVDLAEPHTADDEADTFTYDEKTAALLLTHQVSGKHMLPQLLILQPGGKTSLEQYRPGTERWLFVLEGSAEVTIGAKSYRLAKGNTLYFKASAAHQIQNLEENAPTKIISVSSPAAL
ncbi:MAG: XRE family transcriptional regulator [Candidatus Omnitrophica bacterium]|nr:XRE family transcriptional regulator [Candidatus Omnitrophota bacterium]